MANENTQSKMAPTGITPELQREFDAIVGTHPGVVKLVAENVELMAIAYSVAEMQPWEAIVKGLTLCRFCNQKKPDHHHACAWLRAQNYRQRKEMEP